MEKIGEMPLLFRISRPQIIGDKKIQHRIYFDMTYGEDGEMPLLFRISRPQIIYIKKIKCSGVAVFWTTIPYLAASNYWR